MGAGKVRSVLPGTLWWFLVWDLALVLILMSFCLLHFFISFFNIMLVPLAFLLPLQTDNQNSDLFALNDLLKQDVF